MRALIQRVSEASVTVDGKITGAIHHGLLIFIGIEDADNDDDISWLGNKMINLRIFNDEHGVMNLSVNDVRGDILLVSQFTLLANTKKGNRPSYIRASKADIAIPMYEKMTAWLERELGKKVQQGVFGAEMKVALVNEGPTTIFIDSKEK
jgi:D-tyrosyl-tRNA(Tyr) deacylase